MHFTTVTYVTMTSYHLDKEVMSLLSSIEILLVAKSKDFGLIVIVY